jgi:protein involved in polysaccharide export with SLBB domain
MTRRFPVVLTLMLLASSPALHSQSYPQTPTSSDSLDEQQNSSSVCPDGSSPNALTGGSFECPSSRQDTSRTSPGLGNRPNSVSGPTENSAISGQPNNRNSLQNQKLPPEPLTEFQKFVAATTGQLLPIYGANLFRNVPSTFSPNDLAPVTSDYVLGPDDELRIRIWGQVNYSGNLRVDRSGDIYLPEAGAVHVAGLQFSALDQHLRAAVGRVYRNFDLTADMGRIRSMQIYVAGQARRPGVYTVSSLSSLVDALFASGGPSAQGSLRDIELRRNGKTVTDFDLYALLIHGDKSNDAKLLPEDVLYIPAAGPQVAISGSVRSPGIYELRGAETIADLIDAAGKTTGIASSTRISLERFGDRQIRQAMEFSFDAGGLSATLASGDIVRVYSVVPAYQKTVTLRGDVANPGRFAWKPGMHLSDLIPDRDSLQSRDYWWKRSHLGLPGPEFEPLISNFEANQRRALRNNGYPYDPSTNFPNSDNPFANSPYPNAPESNSLDPTSPAAQDALTSALNTDEKQNTSGYSTEPPAEANGYAGYNGPAAVNRSNDSINDRQQNSGVGTLASQMNQTQVPGSQTKRTDVRISAPEIDWNYAVIERLDSQTLKTSLIPFDLGKLVLSHDTSQDLTLEPGDTVTVFSQADIQVPLEVQTKYVRLEGEFLHAGIYSVQPGETLRDLVRRAGGLSGKAYLYGSEFDRESTRKLQQQRIDEYVRRVDLDASRGTLALAASSATSSGTVANSAAATAAEQALLARLKQIRATGRIVLDFESGSTDIDTIPAISLENGDRFIIPPAPATVNVVGAVYDQNSFLYQNSGSVAQYLRIAGGPDRDADWRHTFVIRADGSVVSRKDVKNLWGNDFAKLKLHPGDTIIVPDKTLRPTVLRGVLDWTQIFAQLAIGAAAIEVLQ